MCWFRKKKNYTINEKKETLVVFKVLPKNELKLNYNLIVPNNYVCYIFTKERLTDCFMPSEVKLYALTMPTTCEIHHLDKPTKNGYKKSVKADLLFVNLNEFNLKNKIKIKKEKDKINLVYSLNYKVKDAKLFLEFLLNERAFFKNDYAEKQLNFYISYLLFNYYFDKEYNYEKVKKYIEEKLAKIGVEILSINIEREFLSEPRKEIFNDYKKDERSVLNNIQNNIKEKDENISINEKDENNNVEGKAFENVTIKGNEDKIKKSIVLIDNFDCPKENTFKKCVEYFTCDCGTILPKNAKHCFKCGKNFEDEDKILCENCGREIGENVHVCPHCHSVLF